MSGWHGPEDDADADDDMPPEPWWFWLAIATCVLSAVGLAMLGAP